MNAIIPDTLQGAVLLSVIDFVASFVIISGIGAVLALFPLLNRFKRAPAALPAAPPVAVAAPEELPIVVIAAAVHVALPGAHRIVHIERDRGGEGWVVEGRLAHHGSHVPPARPT